MRKRWDIFCTVIDNYGDAGVCWRLARQLAAEFELSVRLWIDDLSVLQRMNPSIQIDCDEQVASGVVVRQWREPVLDVVPADVIIEAFACNLPRNYMDAMAKCAVAPIWINLEYLSAEKWVSDCHALPSPQLSGLVKYFFFPGFTENTGGLLKESDLIERRRAFQADAEAQRTFLESMGVDRSADDLLISLFAYATAPVEHLFDALSIENVSTLCVIPQGKIVPRVANYFGVSQWADGARYRRGNLTAITVPFLTQDDYDRLLWCCDLNCVRGEDSFVRAQWAARPFFWHIYQQEADAHWPKLNAFLALYREHLALSAADSLAAAWCAWNNHGSMTAATANVIRELPALRTHAEKWAERLDKRTNLAAMLVQFCANNV